MKQRLKNLIKLLPFYGINKRFTIINKNMQLKNVEFFSFKIKEISLGYCIGDIEIHLKNQIQKYENYEWILQQVANDNSFAIFQLAKCYEFGAYFYSNNNPNRIISIFKSLETAIELYEIAAEIGSKDASHQLGEMYYHGVGLKKDITKAKQYLMKSAELNNIESQYFLGTIEYSEGNIKNAFNYLLKAADLRHPNACYNVAVELHNGDRIWKKNNEMALFYIKVAYETNPSDIDSKNLMEKIYNEIVDKQL